MLQGNVLYALSEEHAYKELKIQCEDVTQVSDCQNITHVVMLRLCMSFSVESQSIHSNNLTSQCCALFTGIKIHHFSRKYHDATHAKLLLNIP